MALSRACLQRVFQKTLRRGQICHSGTVDKAAIRAFDSRHFAVASGSGDTVRIGCASGFWGDTAVSAPQLIHHGNLDFLVFDYLSEITMSLLTAAKTKYPNLGYAPDFVQVAMAPYLKDIKKKGVRVLSNAGGVNPAACVQALKEAADKAGVKLDIAMVTGDDLMPMKDEVSSLAITEMDLGTILPKTLHSMNAYLGAGPIVQALDKGADIVVTGRCTDSALILAPLQHKFQWANDDFDALASGSLAGHLIECGAQATGGIFTDWHEVPDWHKIGFPIVEVEKSGDFILTKPPKTGGLVTTATAGEQLLYEIGDPKNYILPDVVCDFSNVNMESVTGAEGEAVRVTGCQGRSPSTSYKVSATYMDGYRATAVCPVGGPRAAEKGRRTAQAIINRSRGIFKKLGLDDFSKVNIQMLGAEDTYGQHARTQDSREVVIWLSVHHPQKKALEIFAREIAPAGTGMAPGLTGIAGGRPKPSPVLKLFSFLYPKDKLKVSVHMNGDHIGDYTPPDLSSVSSESQSADEACVSDTGSAVGKHRYRLEQVAFTRSGDKGNHVNIGVIARNPSLVPYLRHQLTAEAVDEYLAHLFEDRSGPVEDRVIRYEVPGIHGFNFLLKNALGGGGITSLRSDPQGKATGQMLLDFVLQHMPELKDGEPIQAFKGRGTMF